MIAERTVRIDPLCADGPIYFEIWVDKVVVRQFRLNGPFVPATYLEVKQSDAPSRFKSRRKPDAR